MKDVLEWANVFFSIIVIVSTSYGMNIEEPKSETDWVEHLSGYFGSWLQDGVETEKVLANGKRVDIYTNRIACEADWAKSPKHYEAIGQAKYYAAVTGKVPAVLLLVTEDSEYRQVVDVLLAVRGTNIEVYVYDIPRKRWHVAPKRKEL